jgi:hypothetical protein
MPGTEFFLKVLYFCFSMGYMVLGSSPGKLADPWQDDNAKTMDDILALFNPKLEFYNIAAFMIMNFIENFFDEEEKWLIKISTHAD